MSIQEKKRLNVLLPKRLVEQIDEVAIELGFNRTNFLIHVLNNYLEQKKVGVLSDLLKKSEK